MTEHKLAAKRGGPRIPNKPFIKWCERKLIEYGGPQALRIHINSAGRMCSDNTGARAILAVRLGITDRTLWRYLHYRDSVGRPTTVVGRYYIEDMLARAGVRFSDVYPGIYEQPEGETGRPNDVLAYIDLFPNCFDEDVALEPDEFCRQCGEWVIPIRGFCSWCDTDVMSWVA